MALANLKINKLRNINNLSLNPHPGINLIFGENGSGKTSILEGIHLLGLGRSFRTHLTRRFIQHEEDQCSVFSELDNGFTIGIEKNKTGQTTLRIQGENQTSAAVLAEYLPLQVIDPDGYRLLEDGPKLRRQFLDWGVFHVEHQFMSLWQRVQQALKQRNGALRQQLPVEQVTLWDAVLIEAGDALDQLRCCYFEEFCRVFEGLLPKLLDYDDLKIKYYRGWKAELSLADALAAGLGRDMQVGYTGCGPHRSDIKITVGKGATPAVDVLSRGQQKLLACALRLTHGFLLRSRVDKQCLYLVDDMAAELDETRRTLLAEVLLAQEAQVFITGVDVDVLSGLFHDKDMKMFHVEHGVVSELS